MFDLSSVYPRTGKGGWLSGRSPSSVALDSQGLHLNYASGKTRSWYWADSSSWLVLADVREPISSGILPAESAPFRLTRATLSGIYLTEPAGLALLGAAKAAGRQLVKKRARIPRTPVVSTLYADAASVYARVGRWEPA